MEPTRCVHGSSRRWAAYDDADSVREKDSSTGQEYSGRRYHGPGNLQEKPCMRPNKESPASLPVFADAGILSFVKDCRQFHHYSRR